MSDWNIAPAVKVRAHVQYLDLLEKTMSRYGKEFSEDRMLWPYLKTKYANRYTIRAFKYCLDLGFLFQNKNSTVCLVTVEGERALEDLKQYRIKRRIELLQKKKEKIKEKIEEEVAKLQKVYRQA